MVIIFIIYRRNQEKDAINVQNPMIISLAIGEYPEDPPAPEFEGYVPHLHSVDLDIINSLQLFQTKLNYKCFPEYNNPDRPKIEWNKQELMDFLNERAEALAKNVFDPNNPKRDGWDGLICTISCHGMNNNIITSDYGLVSKDKIHRIFSAPSYAVSREIPRVFMFDCCDGNEERKGIKKKSGDAIQDISNDEEEKISLIDKNKGIDSDSDESALELWDQFTNNPDHRLAVLHAANLDFQSKMNVCYIYKI